jgi:pyruvate formate lyase activating enzyme
MYKMKDVPPAGAELLRKCVKIGREAGLKFIYAGNIPGQDENTVCPICKEMLIERVGYRIMRNSVVEGRCPKCSTALAGVWS